MLLKKSFYCFLFLLGFYLPSALSVTLIPENEVNEVNADPAVIAEQVTLILFNYDYQNFEEALEKASFYFTKRGWKAYKKYLMTHDSFQTEKKLKMTSSVEVVGPIDVTQSENEITAVLPIVITVQNDTINNHQSLTANVKMVQKNGEWKIKSYTLIPRI